MRKAFVSLLFALVCGAAFASDRTLRLDCVFTGGCAPTRIALSSLSVTDGWYGRVVNMQKVPVEGNGRLWMTDDASGETLYANSFSTLYQEWLTTEESKRVVRSYENTFLLPLPSGKATVHISLFDTRRNVFCEFSCPVDPDDILLKRGAESDVARKYVHKGKPGVDCIDVVILAEGYTAAERGKFYRDARAAADAILSTEPFSRFGDRFNFLAVAPASKDSGVSVPRKDEWKRTPASSMFDTFYIERYLTTGAMFAVHDILSGLPYEHIIILANTEGYGGGGIYNAYTLTTAHHKLFKPVVVHEFGHSFGALADEYSTDSYDDPYYFSDVEPWERNITTKVDFDGKWKYMIDSGVPGVGLFEGAGYQSKGVWRPSEDCRMRTNTAEGFCPVCREAVRRMILFNLYEEN